MTRTAGASPPTSIILGAFSPVIRPPYPSFSSSVCARSVCIVLGSCGWEANGDTGGAAHVPSGRVCTSVELARLEEERKLRVIVVHYGVL